MIFPIYPEYISLNDWASRLIEDDWQDSLPPLESDDQWKEWGDGIVGAPYLGTLNIPAPSSMEGDISWQEWAKVVHRILFDQTFQRVSGN